MQEPRYLSDSRYPGPSTHPPPPPVPGLPTQAELDAYPRMFTWGELKGIITSGQLEYLMRNKEMQRRYDVWSQGIKRDYGSTENYLTRARLPWAQSTPRTPQPTFPNDPSASASSHPPRPSEPSQLKANTDSASHLAPPLAHHTAAPAGRSGGSSTLASGSATPASAGFVSLESLQGLLEQHNARKAATQPASKGQTNGDDSDSEWKPEFLRYDPNSGLDSSKYAVLFNDWPYNVPYGVRHYCVWSRVPIAHPHLVDYDTASWSRIESEGLGGFTGITPLTPVWDDQEVISSSSSARTSSSTDETNASPLLAAGVPVDRPIGTRDPSQWYAVDCTFGGSELRRWAGVEYQVKGGEEVGGMVRALWDERGWECLWFVNPPRLQSVPGFSHFHVFARRKTPEEINASEAHWGTDPIAKAQKIA